MYTYDMAYERQIGKHFYKVSELPKDKERKEYYERLFGAKPNFWVLSRYTARRGTIQKWRSGSYNDPDYHTMMSGGHARTVAAAELHSYFPDSYVVTMSKVPEKGNEKNEVNIAKIMADDLVKSGVPREKILLYESSYNTYTELVGMMKMAMERNWRSVPVVMNDFHMQRTENMLRHIARLRDPSGYWQRAQPVIEEFKKSGIKVTLVCAEDILKEMNPRHKRIVWEKEDMAEHTATMYSELEGANQIERDEYWKDEKPDTTIIKPAVDSEDSQ